MANPAHASGSVPRRTLGRTGEEVSAIGLGGFHIGTPPRDEAIAIMHAAVDQGITFFDNCWDYNDGESELRMGLALAHKGYRDRVFLMTKIDGRTKKAAARQIDESLARLRTDRIDLVQIHEVIRMEDPDRCFDDEGTIAALVEAKQAGKLRYIGFTGHKDPAVHLRMLDIADEHGFHFDTAQLPLNVMDAHFRSFEKQVVPRLVRDGIGVLGMKSMAAGKILESGAVTAVECLHYALNLPTSVVITGIDRRDLLDQALLAARTFQPLSAAALSALLAKTAPHAARGRFEPFKIDTMFDGTAQNRHWLG